jgi:WXG100 family type VII secretion target
MADQVRADYEQLAQVASQFSNQAEVVQEMLEKIRSSMDKLENDGWVGRGSDAFFSEMQNEVIPATQRLIQVLGEASRATNDISQTMQQADEEASAPFRVS